MPFARRKQYFARIFNGKFIKGDRCIKQINLANGKPESQGGLPSIGRRGNPPDERERREMLMYATYVDLLQLLMFIVALVGLCYTIYQGRKYPPLLPIVTANPFSEGIVCRLQG